MTHTELVQRISQLETQYAALLAQSERTAEAVGKPRKPRNLEITRRHTIILTLFVIAALSMGAAATQPASKPNLKKLIADQVIANQFVLVAPDGSPRGAFTTMPDGSSALLLSDQNQKAGIGLTVGADGNTTMIFSDLSGKTRARLEIRTDGEPGLTLFDAKEHERTELSLNHGSHPELTMTDANGNQRVRFAIEPDGWSRAQLLDNADHPRVSIVSHPQKAGGLFLIDDKGVPRVTAVTKEKGDPHIETSSADGKPSWRAPQ